MTVKGRIIIEIGDDGQVHLVPDPALSVTDIHGAILSAWRAVVGSLDMSWYRAFRQAEERAAERAEAAAREPGEAP